MFYIRQIEKDDCGFTCLKIMLANLNKDKNYLFLQQDLSHGKYSYKELIDIAHQHGLSLQGYEISDKEEIFDSASEPFMASVIIANENHLVYVYKIDKKKVYVLDPSLGKMTYKKEDFISASDGHILKIEEHVLEKCDEDVETFKYKNTMMLTSLYRLLTVTSIFLGIYFLNKNNSFIYPLIFIVFAFIFEILYRSESIRILKKMDNDLSFDVCSENGYRWNKYYEAFEKQKGVAIAFPGKMVLDVVITLAIIVVSILNSMYNAIPVFISILIVMVDILIASPKFKDQELKLGALERSLFRSRELERKQELVREIHDSSYKYALKKMAFSTVSMFILVISVFLAMLINQIMDLTYLIFYGFIFFELTTYLKSLFTYQNQVEELDYYQAIISNSKSFKKD